MPCPRCSLTHCKNGGKLFNCRQRNSDDVPPPGFTLVPDVDACVPGTRSVFVNDDNFVYCDNLLDFPAADAEEFPDYIAADYTAAPLTCEDCPQPHYEAYVSLYLSDLEDAESRYRVPGADPQPALFSGELGGFPNQSLCISALPLALVEASLQQAAARLQIDLLCGNASY